MRAVKSTFCPAQPKIRERERAMVGCVRKRELQGHSSQSLFSNSFVICNPLFAQSWIRYSKHSQRLGVDLCQAQAALWLTKVLPACSLLGQHLCCVLKSLHQVRDQFFNEGMA